MLTPARLLPGGLERQRSRCDPGAVPQPWCPARGRAGSPAPGRRGVSEEGLPRARDHLERQRRHVRPCAFL